MLSLILSALALCTLLSSNAVASSCLPIRGRSWKEYPIAPTVHNVSVDGLELFYRQAGNPENPTILLLHGYPSSSHQFRHLMPILANKYFVLAPDFPGFGFTTVPESRNYNYTFENIANTVAEFLQALNINSHIQYDFDYGAPVGLRLALKNPTSVRGIISQNGNAYLEGLGAAFSALSNYYYNPTNKTYEDTLRAFDGPDGTKFQYTVGVKNPSVIQPESYTLDSALAAVPGNIDIKLALFRDYLSNVQLYPAFQAYLRTYQPPLLAVWGENDPFFVPAGAEAYKRDVPSAEVVLIDAGHFALETNLSDIASIIKDFLYRRGI